MKCITAIVLAALASVAAGCGPRKIVTKTDTVYRQTKTVTVKTPIPSGIISLEKCTGLPTGTSERSVLDTYGWPHVQDSSLLAANQSGGGAVLTYPLQGNEKNSCKMTFKPKKDPSSSTETDPDKIELVGKQLLLK